MDAGQEELMPEGEAARLLGIAEWRLKELAAQGELRLVHVEGPYGMQVMYFTSEVLALRERLRGAPETVDAEEWPEFIGE